MVIDALVRLTAEKLTDNARFEAEQIVMYALSINKTELITNAKREVSDDEVNRVEKIAARRASGEPLQYILGECEFMSLMFYAESGVLIPRSDTETLVEEVIKIAPSGADILDFCCGNGCVGISLAHYIQDAHITMTDISDKAIELSKRNIKRNNLSDRITVKKSDILLERVEGKFEVIVSNPPYIETDVIDTLDSTVKDYEPHLALNGGKDGLTFYRRITSLAPEMLKDGGILAFEIGYNQGESVAELMEKNFTDVRIIKDLGGNDRVVLGQIARP